MFVAGSMHGRALRPCEGQLASGGIAGRVAAGLRLPALAARDAARIAGNAAARLAGVAAARRAEIAAAIAAFLLYLPSIRYGFVFDDAALIGPDGWPLAVGGLVPYRPLRYASYLVDALLGGSPAVYHAHNVVLHALVCGLVVALARRLGAGRGAAFAGGLLVALHPLGVEAVAYVAGRRDLLCVGLGVAAVLAHTSGRLGAAIVLLLMAALSKESGVVFAAPLALATLAGLDREAPRAAAVLRNPDTQRDARARSTAKRRGVAVLACAAAAIFLVVAYGAIGPWLPSLDAAGLALPGRLLLHYAAGLAGLRDFAPEYPELALFAARVHDGDAAAATAGAAGTVLLVLGVVLATRACRRSWGGRESRSAVATAARAAVPNRSGAVPAPVAFGAAWTAWVFLAVAVWGGLHEPGVDRHAYLLLPPLAVGFALLVSFCEAAWGGRRTGAVLIAVLLIAAPAAAAASRRQMQIWQSERTLWTAAASNPAASSRVRSNYARVLAADGDLEGALHSMNLAVEKNREDPLLLVGRAALRCARGRTTSARRDLARASRLGAASSLVADVARECRQAPATEPAA